MDVPPPLGYTYGEILQPPIPFSCIWTIIWVPPNIMPSHTYTLWQSPNLKANTLWQSPNLKANTLWQSPNLKPSNDFWQVHKKIKKLPYKT